MQEDLFPHMISSLGTQGRKWTFCGLALSGHWHWT